MDVQVINGYRQYVMFDDFQLNNDIWYWDNVISYPDELVELIEKIDLDERSHTRIPKWNPWTASDDSNTIYGATKHIIPDNLRISTGDSRLDNHSLYIINSLKMAVEMCYEKYMISHGLNLNDYRCDITLLPVKKWNEGQSMGPHFDGQDGHTDLAFSLVTYLNDKYEGGEINFPNHSITVKPKAGSLIMFPAQLPYIHQVLPIKSGIRYMMTTSVF